MNMLHIFLASPHTCNKASHEGGNGMNEQVNYAT